MPRFAVLTHDWPSPHRDLLLERGGVLKAWRLPTDLTSLEPVSAIESFDHRVLYLDYEGPVSGDRGSIHKWDGGELHWLSVEADRIVVRLEGTKLSGVFELVRIGGNEWHFLQVRG